MEPGDVFVAAPSVEYGPLLIGPAGCRLFEVFGDLSLSPGGYGPEYRDHPTLRGGTHVFKPREGINRRNEGHSSLSLEGTEGMWKTKLVPGHGLGHGRQGRSRAAGCALHCAGGRRDHCRRARGAMIMRRS